MSTSPLSDILSDADVQALRAELQKDPEALNDLISRSIPTMWPGAQELTDGVMETLLQEKPNAKSRLSDSKRNARRAGFSGEES